MNLTREPRMLTTEELLRQASMVNELPMVWQKELIRRLEGLHEHFKQQAGQTKPDA